MELSLSVAAACMQGRKKPACVCVFVSAGATDHTTCSHDQDRTRRIHSSTLAAVSRAAGALQGCHPLGARKSDGFAVVAVVVPIVKWAQSCLQHTLMIIEDGQVVPNPALLYVGVKGHFGARFRKPFPESRCPVKLFNEYV